MALPYVEDGYFVDADYVSAELYVDWTNKIIHVPKEYMTLIQSTPTTIYEVDVNNNMRLDLKTLEYEFDGMTFIDTHSHNVPVTVGGVTLADVFQIINGYTVTFEDGQYAVNTFGANHNVGDVTNVNQVSVRVSNSAGLVTSAGIEALEYQNRVTIDQTLTTSGTGYPTGTLRQPVGNIPDAALLLDAKGFEELHTIKDLTITPTTTLENKKITGSRETHILTIPDSATMTNCLYHNLSINGALDGQSEIDACIVNSIKMFSGIIRHSIIDGPIFLFGTEEGILKDCQSGDTDSAIPIDMGGDGPPLILSNWSGDIQLRNKTGSTYEARLRMDGGTVKIRPTCTQGRIVLDGNGELIDSSGDSCEVINRMLTSKTLNSRLSKIEFLALS
jgi:hypothetical protein